MYDLNPDAHVLRSDRGRVPAALVFGYDSRNKTRSQAQSHSGAETEDVSDREQIATFSDGEPQQQQREYYHSHQDQA